VLYTNFRPKVDGSDGAIWDRISLIPFNVSFADREDKHLAAKLLDEAEGIMAWAVEGCLEWAEDGLGSCDAVERATVAYHSEMDTIGRFLAERCEFDDDYRIERKALRTALKAYCEEGDEEEIPTANAVTRVLQGRGVRAMQKAYRGVRLCGGDLL